MKSRLLHHLDAAIAGAASQPLKADCLRAERAGLLARQGQLDKAREVIASLQAQYALHKHPAVSGWVNLAEGLVGYYSDLGRSARDKIHRALALSSLAKDTRLRALAAAWLAHMDYVNHEFEAMARNLGDAFQEAAPEHHAARARACLVVAQGYHYGGRFDTAQSWYAQVRLHANVEGDESTISAMMFNMAGLLATQVRQLVLCGQQNEAAAQRAMLSLESAGNFDALLGISSLTSLVPLLRAQMHSLQGRWNEALALYETHFSDGLRQGLAGTRAAMGADLAWCRLQLGQIDHALQEALAAEVAVPHEHDADDRAAAHSRLAQVFEQLGRVDAAASHRQAAAQAWESHAADQAMAVGALDRLWSSISI